MEPTIRPAQVPDEIPLVRQLFREYESQLGFDLCFQNFAQELEGLPGAYAPPGGALFLAFDGEDPVGCIALRAAGADRGEIKRLYVRPAARGQGVGRQLVTRVLDEAKRIGYREAVLDTIETMAAANRLYESLGFCDIPPYCPNPIPGARFLGKRLELIEN
jgi:ribosomal protein S18 acetylase RimI-like enzyme